MKFSGKFAAVAVFAAFGVAAMAVADIGPFSSIRQLAQTSQSIGQATPSFFPAAEPTLDLQLPSANTSALYETDGIPVVNTPILKVFVAVPGTATTTKCKLLITGPANEKHEFIITGPNESHPLDLSRFENGVPITLTACFYKYVADGNYEPSHSAKVELTVKIDSEGPLTSSARHMSDSSSAKSKLNIRFQDDDLPVADWNAAEAIARYTVTNVATGEDVEPTGASSDGRSVTVMLPGSLKVGKYTVQVLSAVTDRFNNPAGRQSLAKGSQPQIEEFRVMGPASAGPAIEFPRYTHRDLDDVDEVFNPGNHVETRVVRTYWNRDAHRVAQIVNRNIKALNQAGVDDKREFVRSARDDKELAERKLDRLERQGIDTATGLRKRQREADEAQAAMVRKQQELNRARQIVSDLKLLGSGSEVKTNQTISNVALSEVTISNGTIIGASLNGIRLSTPETTGGTTVGGEATGNLVSATKTIPNSIVNPIAGDTTTTTGGQTTGESIVSANVIRGTLSSSTLVSATYTGGTITAGSISTNVPISSGSVFGGKVQSGIVHGKTIGGVTRGGITIGKRLGPHDDKTDGNRRTLIDNITSGSQAVTTGGVFTEGTASGASVTGASIVNAGITGATITGATVTTRNPQQARIDQLKNELQRLTGNDDPTADQPMGTLSADVGKAETAFAKAQSEVAAARAAVNAAKLEIADADRTEQTARRNQFEAEVAAGTEDPDTYAAADLNSIDPVMQVSISVIGEGVIQLRGPINGINQIRKMINEIDSPLGQVKVGIFTVQINGEKGDRMDEVASRMEGYIDLSRFLTNQSLQLLRRAVQEVAGEVISQVDYEGHPHRQIDRDRKYVYSFFGRDFIDELYEMDSEFLRTENKLLSLHAMDTVSLSQATFIIALAKNEIRERILAHFLFLVQTELPESEYNQRRMTGMLKKSREINAVRRLIRIPGLPHNPEPKLAPYSDKEFQKYCRKACEVYKFPNFINFFTADVASPNVMTPVQREFIRLAQIFKSQMIAEIELKQRVVERALIQDFAGDEQSQRSEAREQHSAAISVL